MTVFLTPDAKPYFAGTYFPPEPRHGMPGFPELLRHCRRRIPVTQGDDVESRPASSSERLAAAADRAPAPDELAADASSTARSPALRCRSIRSQGGFGGAPKFPPHLALEFLLRRLWADPDDPTPGR